MLRQLRLELFKLTHKGRTYIGFGALLVMAALMVLALKKGPSPFDGGMAGDFMAVGTYLNGGFVAWFLLRFVVMFFLPLFACVVIGDMISGEAGDGTLRASLSKPVRRERLYGAKFLVSALYALALTFFVGISAYVIGVVFLGRGSLVTFQTGSLLGVQGIYIFNEGEGTLRLLAAYAFATLSVMSVATIAFFLSSMVSNSLSAIGGAMVSVIVFQIMGVIDYFKPIQPYLFTTHFDAWNLLFATPVPWHALRMPFAVLSSYVVVFFALGFWIFRRKDILS